MPDHFADRLCQSIQNKRTPLVVGLDPRIDQLPTRLSVDLALDDWPSTARRVTQFCTDVIDVVAPLVPAVKIQVAFFEQLGPAGGAALADVLTHARQRELVTILDAKRGDIDSTAEAYAASYLTGDRAPWPTDALTANPYLGDDSLAPMVRATAQYGTGLFVLVKTSNRGAGGLQDAVAGDRSVSRVVADWVEGWASQSRGRSGYGSVGAVVGATWREQLTEFRGVMPSAILLVPGFGAQGGTAADVAPAFDSRGLGAIVNSSRAIIYAYRLRPPSTASNWQSAVEAAARDAIDQLRAQTPAGRL